MIAGIDRGRARDRGGDDVGLGHQALHPGVDQALAELVEVEDAARRARRGRRD